MVLYTLLELANPAPKSQIVPSAMQSMTIDNYSPWAFRLDSTSGTLQILPFSVRTVPVNPGSDWQFTPSGSVESIELGDVQYEVDLSFSSAVLSNYAQSASLPLMQGNVNITNAVLDIAGTVNANITNPTLDIGTISGTVNTNITNATLDIGTISSISGTVNTNITNATLDIGNVGAISGTVAISGNVGILVGQSISLTGTAIVEPSSSSGMPVTTGSGGLDVSVTNTVNAQITSSTVTLPISIADTVNMAITSSTVTVDSNIQNGVVPGNNLVYLGVVTNNLGVITGAVRSNDQFLNSQLLSTPVLADAVYCVMVIPNGNAVSDGFSVELVGVLGDDILPSSGGISSLNMPLDGPTTLFTNTDGTTIFYRWTLPTAGPVANVVMNFALAGNPTAQTIYFYWYARYASAEVVNAVTSPVNNRETPLTLNAFTVPNTTTTTTLVASGGYIRRLIIPYTAIGGAAGTNCQFLNGSDVLATVSLPSGTTPAPLNLNFEGGVTNNGISIAITTSGSFGGFIGSSGYALTY